jgi:protein-disulfide isomerase
MNLNPTSRLVLPVGPRDHVRGSAAASVTLVEYGDYECPHCGQAYVVVEQLLDRVGSYIQFAFRHFPISSRHPHAQHAAEAAEAAGAQGMFWAMHALIFENQDALDDRSLVQYAAALGLDALRFTSDLARHIYAGRVREDFLSGARSGVNGTPTFFVNGFRHEGGYDLDSLLDSVEYALEAVGSRR